MKTDPKRICVIGPGTRFLSGITYYTIRLANAFAEKQEVSTILLRNLVPKFLFPGGKRVGNALTDLNFVKKIQVFDGIDWYLIPKIFTVPWFLIRNKPDIIIFQWWTSSVAHIYLVLLIYIKLLSRKSKLILTFHETQDPFENTFFLLRIYSKVMGKVIFRYFDEYAVHSNNDLELIHEKFNLPKPKISVVEHGSYDHFKKPGNQKREKKDICSLLFFGLIRPYKGVEYLIDAFDKLPKNKIDKFELVIAGEPWDYDLPAKKIAASPNKAKIRYIDRYISDTEVDNLFNQADVGIFPYTRASQSGAAHAAISYGIPVIISRVGGLKESMADYKGTIFVEPCNIDELRDAILKSLTLKGKKFQDPHPWENTVGSYEKIFNKFE